MNLHFSLDSRTNNVISTRYSKLSSSPTRPTPIWKIIAKGFPLVVPRRMVKFWLVVAPSQDPHYPCTRPCSADFPSYRTWTEQNRESGLQNYSSPLSPRPDESRPRRYKKNSNFHSFPVILALSPPLRILFTGEIRISTTGPGFRPRPLYNPILPRLCRKWKRYSLHIYI